MDSATITALVAGIPTILTAITGLVIAIKAHSRATTARDDAKEAGTLATAAHKAVENHKSVHVIGGKQ